MNMENSTSDDMSVNFEDSNGTNQDSCQREEKKELKFIKNTKGKETACFCGFMYIYHTDAKLKGKTYWQCIDRGCPGRLQLMKRPDGKYEVIKETGKHFCNPKPGQMEVKEKIQELLDKAGSRPEIVLFLHLIL